jgi:hypothetical protein
MFVGPFLAFLTNRREVSIIFRYLSLVADLCAKNREQSRRPSMHCEVENIP